MILTNREKFLPELLSPAGGYPSLEAAVCAGADAVYFGTKSYNARMNASNFSDDELKSACGLCHAHGVKVYVTLNTQLYDREIFHQSNDSEGSNLLKRVEFLYNTGVDAIISADVGVSSLIHSEFPDFPIHASTQASGHGALSAEFLKKLGFTRMVCARELSKNDIESVVKNSGIEVEMFIHGAYCVSYSGQCLMSWAMGGRSGNRGECAQPCRLPYASDSENKYPLSLKDMSLASHITELIDIGVSSLKIEGRMKNPSYVYGVTKIYRRLLDENRNANPDEMHELASYFSRSGFSDGYFIGKTNASMLGIRSESDKEESRNKSSSSSLYSGLTKKVPVEIEVSVKKDAPSEMTMKSDFREVTVLGDIPIEAVNAPLSENDVIKNISKLGQTPFAVGKIKADVGENLILPVSRLNFLRRSACDEMLKTEREIHFHRDDEFLIEKEFFSHRKTVFSERSERSGKIQTAEFLSESQITDAALKYFKIRFIPVEKFQSGKKTNGISLPPVIFDSEIESVTQILKNAVKCGINHIMISNTGHIDFVRNLGFSAIQIHGSFRLNVFNSYTAEILGKTGLSSYTLSPELILPQMRDIGSANENMLKSVIVYGKIPLMYIQRCVINNRKSDGKGTCGRSVSDGCVSVISDRTGAKMNIYGSFGHRNIIYNSVPVYMADKPELINITGAGMHHFIFSSESCEEVNKIINSYRQNLPSDDKIKRINNR